MQIWLHQDLAQSLSSLCCALFFNGITGATPSFYGPKHVISATAAPAGQPPHNDTPRSLQRRSGGPNRISQKDH